MKTEGIWLSETWSGLQEAGSVSLAKPFNFSIQKFLCFDLQVLKSACANLFK